MLSIRLLNRKKLVLSFDENKENICISLFDCKSNLKQSFIKIDRDIAYRIHKSINKILKNLSFIPEEIHFEPLYIKIKKNQIVIESLSSVNDIVIDFDDIGFEYFGEILREYALSM